MDETAAALRQVGVRVEAVAAPAAGGEAAHACAAQLPAQEGVVFFAAVTPPVCDFIRAASRQGQRRLLAVALPPRRDQGRGDGRGEGTAWEILAAGASDVLRWGTGGATPGATPGDIPGAIAARIRRWQEVDELLGSPLVRKQMVGESPAWRDLLRQVVEVARFAEPDDAPVLLIGETGTGKELIARLIHALSPRRARRDLVIVDCTTIVPELSGSELFGHERGAFTGAVAARDGALALADGGTLFLDEVGELPLELQAQLLRAIQERTYKRVGGNRWQSSDFRLVCATNRDLLVEEAHGRFRRDLYFRIAGWDFRLPPLRERLEDVLPLARHFVQQKRQGQAGPGLAGPEFDVPVLDYLLTRAYPGNVRDLRNLVLRLAERHVGPGPITIGAIPTHERPQVMPMGEGRWDQALEPLVRKALLRGAGLREIRQAAEETAIRVAVGDEDGNLQRAARVLGITDRALQLRRAEQRQRAGGDDRDVLAA